MESTILFKPDAEKIFPCLGMYTATGTIVLFTDINTGTVVASTKENEPLGLHSNMWGNSWITTDQEVLLSNSRYDE